MSATTLAVSKARRYASKPVGRAPKPTSLAVSNVMRSNKSSGTKPELILADLLRKPLVKSNLPGSPDFVYAKSMVVVFVNGCWWHRCPVENYPLPKSHTEFWKRKFERNVERDRLNGRELESKGWTVLVVWEHEIRGDAASVASRIRREVSRLSPRRQSR
jgi:DNA mismatch endonuclease, patch repair protein